MQIADGITFRDCSCFDWRRVASLISGTFPSEPSGAIAHALRTQYIRLCLRGTEIVGFYVYAPRHRDGELWLDYIGVANDARRSGLGKKLLDDLEDQARKRGFFKIGLAVDSINAGAIELYEKNGFQRSELTGDGSRPSYARMVDLPAGRATYKVRRPALLFDLTKRAYLKLLYWIVVGTSDRP